MRVSRRRSPPLPPLHGHHKRPQSSTMVGGRGRFKCYAPAILGHARRCRAPQGLRIGCVGLPWAAVAPSTAIFYWKFTLILTGGGSTTSSSISRGSRSSRRVVLQTWPSCSIALRPQPAARQRQRRAPPPCRAQRRPRHHLPPCPSRSRRPRKCRAQPRPAAQARQGTCANQPDRICAT